MKKQFIMNKDFTLYDEALALKELGFDEPCFAIHRNNKTYLISELEKINSKKESVIAAPTYSEAFRWFRKKHNLHHDIGVIGDWDKPQYKYIVSGKTMNNPAHMWYYETANSYEEAELACLRKLIEIVKIINKEKFKQRIEELRQVCNKELGYASDKIYFELEHLVSDSTSLPDIKDIELWLSKQNYQKEQGEQEYMMYFDVDIPKIIQDYIENLKLEI